MSIDQYFTSEFTVKRMVWSGDSSAETEQGTFKGHLQQARAEDAENLKLVFTKTFAVWCPVDTDVEEGDTLVLGSNTYNVRAISTKNYGNNQHLELIVEKDVTD